MSRIPAPDLKAMLDHARSERDRQDTIIHGLTSLSAFYDGGPSDSSAPWAVSTYVTRCPGGHLFGRFNLSDGTRQDAECPHCAVAALHGLRRVLGSSESKRNHTVCHTDENAGA